MCNWNDDDGWGGSTPRRRRYDDDGWGGVSTPDESDYDNDHDDDDLPNWDDGWGGNRRR